MLKRLEVKNFALIDDLEINFHSGLTALTGETGSGKSILLESLLLLFGKRSDAEFIRFGSSKAVVVGTFNLNTPQMKELELPETITLTREIDSSGRHMVLLNESPITIAKLKKIANTIGLIHGQDDTHLLMDKGSYLDFLDQMDVDKTNQLLQVYLLKRSTYQEKNKHLETLKNKRNESIERIDFLTFQVNELKSLSLKLNEKEELQEKIDLLKNFDKIKQSLKQATDLLHSNYFQTDVLYDAVKSIDKIQSYDKSYEEIHKIIEDSYYNLEEAKKMLLQNLRTLDFDEDTFNTYQERVFDLNRIELKYGKSTNDLIEYLETIKEELALSLDYDGYLKQAKEKVDIAYKETYDKGLEIHNLRLKLASRLEKELTKSLKELDLNNAQFKIDFDEISIGNTLNENGLDNIDFMISLNEGEPLKPLAKVASGGEKARFMFSLKTLFAKESGLSMLVFDEIDIGISGKTASKVANKMKEISELIQILVITHVPQVAAKADHQYQIYKEKSKDRMETFIKTLTPDERIMEIAVMLSDEKVSSYAINQAKELLAK